MQRAENTLAPIDSQSLNVNDVPPIYIYYVEIINN